MKQVEIDNWRKVKRYGMEGMNMKLKYSKENWKWDFKHKLQCEKSVVNKVMTYNSSMVERLKNKVWTKIIAVIITQDQTLNMKRKCNRK